jgi:tetratricopeptide (TPR) repeat protein
MSLDHLKIVSDVVLVLVLLFPFLAFGPLVLYQLAWQAHGRGDYRRAVRLIGLLRRLPSAFPSSLHVDALAMSVHAARGQSDEAIAIANLILERLKSKPRRFDWHLVNTVIDIYINAGLYQEAIECPEMWPLSVRERAAKIDPFSATLVRLNHAEAIDNLGRPEEALAIVNEVLALPFLNEATRFAARLSRAWILARRGRSEEAAQTLLATGFRIRWQHYGPEAHFTEAVVALSQARLDDALEAAREGQQQSTRASSARNALFLLGEIKLRQSRAADALIDYQNGIEHTYQRQGGHALCVLAQHHEDAGDIERAAQVRRLIAERDPQFVFVPVTTAAPEVPQGI